MSSDSNTSDSNTNDSLFHTPNPTELKAAAKQDPIQERSDQHEANVAETSDEYSANLGREGVADVTPSQVTTANLSGH